MLPHRLRRMTSIFFVTYGLFAYLFFLATFLCFIGFVGGLPLLPHTIDSGNASPLGTAVAVDLALITSFGLQHSVMARASFKRLWARVVPAAIERSTYVLASTLALVLVMGQWRPIASPVIWEVTGAGAVAMQVIFWAGWAMMLTSSFLLNHFELFGLSQVGAAAFRLAAPEPEFRTPLFYRYVRHPLYTGLLAAFWSAPLMTLGHLLFALGMTAYIVVGIAFEERDLVEAFGSRYADYRRRVGMLLPWRRA